jgi:hypothetical protein
VERGATRGQHAQARRRRQQFRDDRPGRGELLEVIEHQHNLAVADAPRQRVLERFAGHLANTEDRRDRHRHQGCIRDRGQVHEVQLRRGCTATNRELDRETRLAASPRSHDGDEARAAEGDFELGELT